MSTSVCKETTAWTIRIPRFTKEQRSELEAIAKAHRMNIGAYVGNVLEEIINASKSETVYNLASSAPSSLSLNTPKQGAGEALSQESV